MKQILIVEDDLNVRTNINELLEANGYFTTSASNGIEAIDVYSNKKFDLIISDVKMPELDGYQLYKRILEHSGEDTPPFIFLTARTDREFMREAMNLGADDYITKPFNTEELLKSIEIRLKKSTTKKLLSDNLQKNLMYNFPNDLLENVIAIQGFADKAIQAADFNNTELYEALLRIKTTGLDLHEKIDKILKYFEIENLKNNQEKDTQFKSFQITQELIEELIETRFKNDFNYHDLRLNVSTATLDVSSNYFQLILTEFLEYFTRYTKIGSNFNIGGYTEDDHYYISVEMEILDNEEILGYLNSFSKHLNKSESRFSQFGLGILTARRAISSSFGEVKFQIIAETQGILEIKLPLNNMKYN